MELRGHSIYAYQTEDDEDAVVKMKPAKVEEVEEVEDDTFQDDEDTLTVKVSTKKDKKKDNYKYYQDDANDDEEDSALVALFATISTWFIRIGMAVGVILLLYFIFTGKFSTAFLYILGLIVAFFFGYFFMFLLDKFTSAN